MTFHYTDIEVQSTPDGAGAWVDISFTPIDGGLTANICLTAQEAVALGEELIAAGKDSKFEYVRRYESEVGA